MKNLIVLAVIAALLVGAAWYMSKEEEKTIEQAAVPVRDVFGGSITSGTLTRPYHCTRRMATGMLMISAHARRIKVS